MGSKRVMAIRILGPAWLALAVIAGGVGPASASPTAAPVPLQRLAALSGHPLPRAAVRTGQRQALRVAAREDGTTYVDVDPACSVGGHKAKPNASVDSSAKLKVDYLLTGTGDLHKTGTVKVKADHPKSLKLKAVPIGSYRLTLTEHGTSEPIGDESFDVLPCMSVTTSCHAATFTNPAGNPPAYVDYSGTAKKAQTFDVMLAAGESRTVRIDYSKVEFQAEGELVDHGVELGTGTAKVKQKCAVDLARPGEEAVQTTGSAACSDSGPGTVDLSWSAQSSLTDRRYEVLDAQQQIVAHDSFKGGHDAELSLARGTYTYRSYANNVSQPFEDVSFAVLECAQVTPVCRALEIDNPNAADLQVVVLGFDDDTQEVSETDTTAAGSTTTTVPWQLPGAYVFAWALNDDLSSRFYSDAVGDAALDEIAVPQNCCSGGRTAAVPSRCRIAAPLGW